MSEASESAGLDLLQALLAEATTAGASAADAVMITGTSLSVQRRLGRIEHMERSEARDLGLRVFIGARSAIVSATSMDPAGFSALAARAVDMARVVPEDPFGGLVEAVTPIDPGSLDLDDGEQPDEASLAARAAAAEDSAMSVPGVTNSEGASADFSRSEFCLATSRGFSGRYTRSRHSISATALAGTGVAMQRDYDHSSATHLVDLDDAEGIGRSAGERAVARLNPSRPRTARVDVVYHPRVASSLLGHLVSAINGASIARGTSFLREQLGQAVFPRGVFVHDDPMRLRGLRSRPFDGEGNPSSPRAIVEDGMLTSWLLDNRSARQLGLVSTGHATRGASSPPAPGATNLYFAPGVVTAAALMADIKIGLYVTELIGMGINTLTGDYSRGAAGFMIRSGALAEPVAEVTIAGTLSEMFRSLSAADDLRFHRGIDSPTIRVNGMTMAGA